MTTLISNFITQLQSLTLIKPVKGFNLQPAFVGNDNLQTSEKSCFGLAGTIKHLHL